MADMNSPIPEAEWDVCHEYARTLAAQRLLEMGASASMVEYVRGLRGYYRVCYLLAAWEPDFYLRRELAATLALHLLSMKLLDDLADGDTKYHPIELGVGMVDLQLQASAKLVAYHPEIFAAVAPIFHKSCQGQLACKIKPANSFQEWQEYARDYASRFFSAYGKMAGFACRLGVHSNVPETFAAALGMIIAVVDDLSDYTRFGERVGNLGALLEKGTASAEEVTSLLEQEKATAHQALARLEPRYDLRPPVDAYVDLALHTLLPKFTKRASLKPV